MIFSQKNNWKKVLKQSKHSFPIYIYICLYILFRISFCEKLFYWFGTIFFFQNLNFSQVRKAHFSDQLFPLTPSLDTVSEKWVLSSVRCSVPFSPHSCPCAFQLTHIFRWRVSLWPIPFAGWEAIIGSVEECFRKRHLLHRGRIL